MRVYVKMYGYGPSNPWKIVRLPTVTFNLNWCRLCIPTLAVTCMQELHMPILINIKVVHVGPLAKRTRRSAWGKFFAAGFHRGDFFNRKKNYPDFLYRLFFNYLFNVNTSFFKEAPLNAIKTNCS